MNSSIQTDFSTTRVHAQVLDLYDYDVILGSPWATHYMRDATSESCDRMVSAPQLGGNVRVFGGLV